MTPYLGRFQWTGDAFERDLLHRALHRRALAFRPVVVLLMPRYFEIELRTARFLGNSPLGRELMDSMGTL